MPLLQAAIDHIIAGFDSEVEQLRKRWQDGTMAGTKASRRAQPEAAAASVDSSPAQAGGSCPDGDNSSSW